MWEKFIDDWASTRSKETPPEENSREEKSTKE